MIRGKREPLHKIEREMKRWIESGVVQSYTRQERWAVKAGAKVLWERGVATVTASVPPANWDHRLYM